MDKKNKKEDLKQFLNDEWNALTDEQLYDIYKIINEKKSLTKK